MTRQRYIEIGQLFAQGDITPLAETLTALDAMIAEREAIAARVERLANNANLPTAITNDIYDLLRIVRG